jgi:hypothetical protein
MPRNSTPPVIVLALSISGAMRALGLPRRVIHEALIDGSLIARSFGPRVRIPVFGVGGLEGFFNAWPRYLPKTRTKKG